MQNRLFTSVELPKSTLQIDHSAPLLLMGSCFAENIGKRLQTGGFRCDINPFGVLYNPFSIANALRQIMSGEKYHNGSTELIYHEGYWHSMMHHSCFSAETKEECLAKINRRLDLAREIICRAQCLVLTFGTAYVYLWGNEGNVVGNCHKLPERNFFRRRLSVEEIVEEYGTLIDILHRVNPSLQVLFTVSPIRHRRDGMLANQLSKSTLLLAVAEIIERCPQMLHYFPAYEIMMDELRDYRFYAEDMLHPSELAVDYMWERFGCCYFAGSTRQCLREWKGIRQGLEHRPSNPDSEVYKQFLSQLELRISQFQAKYPTFDTQKELSLCRTRLNK